MGRSSSPGSYLEEEGSMEVGDRSREILMDSNTYSSIKAAASDDSF